jgi:hypothetical protein
VELECESTQFTMPVTTYKKYRRKDYEWKWRRCEHGQSIATRIPGPITLILWHWTQYFLQARKKASSSSPSTWVRVFLKHLTFTCRQPCRVIASGSRPLASVKWGAVLLGNRFSALQPGRYRVLCSVRLHSWDHRWSNILLSKDTMALQPGRYRVLCSVRLHPCD